MEYSFITISKYKNNQLYFSLDKKFINGINLNL